MAELTITFKDTPLGVTKVESNPSMGDLAKKIAGGYQLTLAEAMFSSAMFHLKKVAKGENLVIKSERGLK